jgi:hypothetical protein
MFPPTFHYKPSDEESDDDYSHEYGSMAPYLSIINKLKITIPTIINNKKSAPAPSAPKSETQSIFTW